MSENVKRERTLGLLDATGIGVGAIVGGGILALAGVAFSITGPGAMLAFGLNGLIAIITALSFAEMAVAFPQSGGIYNYAKRVLSVQTAFAIGWIVWFASIVAAVLYATGFASFFLAIFKTLLASGMLMGDTRTWSIILESKWLHPVVACLASMFFSAGLMRKNAGGGQWINISKIAVFIVLILGGAWALRGVSVDRIGSQITPLFPGGWMGLVQAMGYTFIALQGFDLIAAAAGEVKKPEKNLPRAMLLSISIALLIYIPLLFFVSTAGVPAGETIQSYSNSQGEMIIASAAQNYLGQFGYWLVMLAGLLSMLSALQANIFAASRISLKMARDRTLPRHLDRINERYGTPHGSILATALLIAVIIFAIPDVSAAGAASSLIFLLTFALAHGLSMLIRTRGSDSGSTFRLPLFPLIPVTGITVCSGLALFQGIMVPAAGAITATWLLVGAMLYLILFAQHAKIVDASEEGRDPHLIQLRGRRPLVLVPIANPVNTPALIAVANAMSPPVVGKILLLQVVNPPSQWHPGVEPQQLIDAQAIIREALAASFVDGIKPQALTTISLQPWEEIKNVATLYRCEILVLGFSKIAETIAFGQLENLIGSVDCDVVVLRSSPHWSLKKIRKVLVPIGGLGKHDILRARLIGSLSRTYGPDITFTFLQILPENTTRNKYALAVRELSLLVQDEVPGKSEVKVIKSQAVEEELMTAAKESDLMVIGLQRVTKKQKAFSAFTVSIARQAQCPIIMISRKG